MFFTYYFDLLWGFADFAAQYDSSIGDAAISLYVPISGAMAVVVSVLASLAAYFVTCVLFSTLHCYPLTNDYQY